MYLKPRHKFLIFDCKKKTKKKKKKKKKKNGLTMCPCLDADVSLCPLYTDEGWSGGNMGSAHWGLGEIDGLNVPPGKASNLLTDHLITG